MMTLLLFRINFMATLFFILFLFIFYLFAFNSENFTDCCKTSQIVFFLLVSKQHWICETKKILVQILHVRVLTLLLFVDHQFRLWGARVSVSKIGIHYLGVGRAKKCIFFTVKQN